MRVQNSTSGFSFSRNPVIIRENFPGDAFDRRGGRLTVMIAGTDVYEGRFFPPLDIDIAEIIDASIENFPEPHTGNTSPLVAVCDSGELSDYSVCVRAEYGSYASECSFLAIPGGVSKQNFRRFVNLGKDAFDTRYLNPKVNCFLTTRTAGRRIIMKETELYPLYFLINQAPEQISVVETVTGTKLTFSDLDTGVWTLNVDSLRRHFIETHGIMPSVFQIYRGGTNSCCIVVERAENSKERYRLKFRNSLGVFEIIELTGELSVVPEYDDADDATFNRLDTLTGDFYTERERVERRQSLTVETGVKRPDEVRFLMDMIASEEVYLLDLMPLPVKVIPSVDDFTYRVRPLTPEKFTLKLTVADSEINIMQDIVDGTEGVKPRVFSKQFGKQFI